jgi:DNA-binding NarL/FixJ family response regulator
MQEKNRDFFDENILIVDDHPLTVEVHKEIIANALAPKKNYYSATTAQNAFNTLKELHIKKETIKMCFYDVNLPEYQEENIKSGEDLALLTRKLFPACKIIIISMHSEPLWVNRIIKAINPEGFISKSDMDAKLLSEACNQIEKGFFYYSSAIIKSNKVIIQQNVNWDEHDTKILQLIADGVKTAHLPKLIPLSLSAIEKRKSNIKRQLIFNTGSDKDLIDKAKSMGLL